MSDVPDFAGQAAEFLSDIERGEIVPVPSHEQALAIFGPYMFAEGVRVARARMAGCESLLDELEAEAEAQGRGVAKP